MEYEIVKISEYDNMYDYFNIKNDGEVDIMMSLVR